MKRKFENELVLWAIKGDSAAVSFLMASRTGRQSISFLLRDFFIDSPYLLIVLGSTKERFSRFSNSLLKNLYSSDGIHNRGNFYASNKYRDFKNSYKYLTDA